MEADGRLALPGRHLTSPARQYSEPRPAIAHCFNLIDFNSGKKLRDFSLVIIFFNYFTKIA